MQTANIRERLHHFIDEGDVKLLKLMYAVAKEYNDEDDLEYEFSDEEIRLFERAENETFKRRK